MIGAVSVSQAFLTGKSLGEGIQRLCRESDGLCLAVAFWGAGASDRLRPVSGSRILCDLGSGACNPSEIRALIKRGCEVRTRDGMHAKVYLSPSAAIVSSANASANGLGLEGNEVQDDLPNRPGNEAGYLVTEPQALASIRDWFEELWADPATSSVKESTLRLAEAEWKRRRPARPVRRLSGEIGLLKAFRTDPRVFDDRPFFVAHTSGYGDETADSEAKDHIQESGQVYTNGDGGFIEGGVANWVMDKKDIKKRYPPGSWLIEIWTGEDKDWSDPELRVSAFWEFLEEPNAIPLKAPGYEGMVNVLTRYLTSAPLSARTHLKLQPEDQEALVRGFQALDREVAPLALVLRAAEKAR